MEQQAVGRHFLSLGLTSPSAVWSPKPFRGQLSILKAFLPGGITFLEVLHCACLRNRLIWELEVVSSLSCAEEKKIITSSDTKKEGSLQVLRLGKRIGFFFFFKEIESCTSFSINVGLVSESLGILGRIQSPPPSSFCGGGSMRAERRNDATRGSGPASSQVRARLALHGLPLLVDQRPPRY